jgi:phosphoribosylformylglycinamidine synthase PurS subunit
VRATVLVRPKPGILDPQGEAVLGSLKQLGFAVDDARIGRVVDLELQNGDREQARADLERMCEQLLANPLIESYEIELLEDQGPSLAFGSLPWGKPCFPHEPPSP